MAFWFGFHTIGRGYMSRGRGFVLFEYMIAFACSAMMIFMVASVLSDFYVRIEHFSAGCMTTIEVARAWFSLDRDLSAASSDMALWKKRSPSEFVVSTPSGDCGWAFKRDRLIRTKGFYDVSRGVWHNAHDSVALGGVARFMVRWIIAKGIIQGYEVTLESRNQSLDYYVACRGEHTVPADN